MQEQIRLSAKLDRILTNREELEIAGTYTESGHIMLELLLGNGRKAECSPVHIIYGQI